MIKNSNSNSLASIQFDLLEFNQNSCIQHCVVITIYLFLESGVLLKYDPHNLESNVIKVSFSHILVTSMNLSSTLAYTTFVPESIQLSVTLLHGNHNSDPKTKPNLNSYVNYKQPQPKMLICTGNELNCYCNNYCFLYSRGNYNCN